MSFHRACSAQCVCALFCASLAVFRVLACGRVGTPCRLPVLGAGTRRGRFAETESAAQGVSAAWALLLVRKLAGETGSAEQTMSGVRANRGGVGPFGSRSARSSVFHWDVAGCCVAGETVCAYVEAAAGGEAAITVV